MKRFLLPLFATIICVSAVQAAAPNKALAAPAPDTIRIAANDFESIEYGKDKDWFIAMYSTDSTYLVCFDYVSETLSGTFRLQDMIADYSWIQVRKGKKYIDYKAVTLNVQKNKDKSVDLNADISGSDGKVYIVTAHYVPKRPSITPKDTVTYTFHEAELNIGNISFQMHTEDKPEVYFSTILYYEGLIEGSYTEAETAPYGACIRVGKKWIDAVRYDLTVTQKDYVYQADAKMTGNDSVLYIIHMTSHSLVPKRTVDIAIHNMTIENLTATQGIYYLDGFNDEYEVSVEVTSDSIADGELTTGFVATVRSQTSSTSGMQTMLTMNTEEKRRYVKINMLGKDTVLYRIDMGYVIPTPTDTVDVDFDQSCELTHAKAAGNYQFYNRNDKYIAAVDVHTDTLGGIFRGDDIDKYYSFIGVIRGRDTLGVRVMDAKVALSQAEDTTRLAAEMIGDDSIMYRVTMFYVPPVAKDTMVLHIQKAQYNDLLAQGAYQVHGYTADSAYYLSITPFAEKVEGTYEVSDMYQKYSYIAHFEDKNTFSRIAMYSGEVTTTLRGRYLNMTGGIMGRDSIYYKVQMSAMMPMPYDSVSGEVNFAYGVQDYVTINTAYLADSSMILFDAVAYGVINNTFIRFNTNRTEDATIIPTGVYPIDDSRKSGTVYAGGIETDSVGNQVLTPSFYARTWMDGRVVPPLYFMVEGTVSVENREGYLYIEVNARNSYGRPIHITYNSNPTPVENVTTPPDRATKVVKDGQVLIKRGKEVFNLLGGKVR